MYHDDTLSLTLIDTFSQLRRIFSNLFFSPSLHLISLLVKLRTCTVCLYFLPCFSPSQPCNSSPHSSYYRRRGTSRYRLDVQSQSSHIGTQAQPSLYLASPSTLAHLVMSRPFPHLEDVDGNIGPYEVARLTSQWTKGKLYISDSELRRAEQKDYMIPIELDK